MNINSIKMYLVTYLKNNINFYTQYLKMKTSIPTSTTTQPQSQSNK